MAEPNRLEQFAQYLERRAPGRRTTLLYVSDVRQFAAVISKPWREITMQDIDTFVDQQRQAGLSAATVKRRVAALKVFFDFLAEETGDLRWANPVRFKRHAGKQPRRLPRDLKDAEVARLWAVITSPRDRAWFALLWRAGLRVGELVGLRLDSLLAAPSGDQPARLRVLGKGQKERLVLLTADAYAVLTAWLVERPASDDSHIFLNDRGQPLTVNGIEWLLRQYGQQVGLPITPHQLRHTFARQVTEAGLPITSLSKLLGHAQITTTQIYTAGADPQLAAAYQQAMAHVAPAASSPDLVAPQPPSAPLDTTIAPLAPPALPEEAAWGTHLAPTLRTASLAFVRSRLAYWKPQRQRHRALQVLGELRRFWDWLAARRPGCSLAAIQLDDLQTYRSERIASGCTARTPDVTLSYVVALLRDQADRGQAVDASVFRLHPLPRPVGLPRHLSESERQGLEHAMQQRLATADATQRLENACFFVLAHGGLRASECVELQFQDCDLPGRRLLIRQGKGLRDRVVYLSDTACAAIQHYLAGWARLPTAPLFTHPNGRPISYEWLWACIGKLGDTAGVPGVTPHRLRHTLATHLLNVGMDITQIQKLLGHQHLDTTMIYARVLDTTLEAQYRRAMAEIERQQPPLSATPVAVDWPIAGQDALSQPTATHNNQLANSV
jgi:site-specific recombinase XerD